MQIIAPPQIRPETITAFFAAMRLWLLEAVTPLIIHLTARTPQGRAIRAWLNADVRDALDDMKRMLFAMAVARMAPVRQRPVVRGGARPGTSHPGFRAAPRSRNWLRLMTRDLKPRGHGLRARLALLRDLITRPDHWITRIGLRAVRLKRSRKGARFLCVAPPALVLFSDAPACALLGADTS